MFFPLLLILWIEIVQKLIIMIILLSGYEWCLLLINFEAWARKIIQGDWIIISKMSHSKRWSSNLRLLLVFFWYLCFENIANALFDLVLSPLMIIKVADLSFRKPHIHITWVTNMINFLLPYLLQILHELINRSFCW